MQPPVIAPPKTYDSAYPGSMFEEPDGRYVRADDNASLLAALWKNLVTLQRENQDLKDALVIAGMKP